MCKNFQKLEIYLENLRHFSIKCPIFCPKIELRTQDRGFSIHFSQLKEKQRFAICHSKFQMHEIGLNFLKYQQYIKV